MDKFVDSITAELSSLNLIFIILSLLILITKFFYLKSAKDRGSLASITGSVYLTFTLTMLFGITIFAPTFAPIVLLIILFGYYGNVRATVKNKNKGTRSYSLLSIVLNIAAFVAVLMIFLFIALFVDSCLMTRSSSFCNRG